MKDALPRRPFLGLSVREELGGLVVTGLVEGGSGERAGLEVGDRLVALDGAPIGGARALVDALWRGEIALRFLRGAETHTARITAVPFPKERVAGAGVRYEHVVVGGARWRTIVTTPSAPGPHPAMLFLGGIDAGSLDLAGREHTPLARFFAALAPSIATLRLERGGVGDGEGPPPAEIDFETERAGYRAAMARLRGLADEVHLFGHSVGGMHAPGIDGAASRVVYGASAARWSQCVAAGVRRQMILRGRDEAAIAARARAAAAFESAELSVRPRAFHAQLDAMDLVAAWRATEEPVLVLIGEHDWVVSEDGQRRIAEVAARSEVRPLAGVDHAFSAHDSLEESLAALGRGRFAAALAESVRAWIHGGWTECRAAPGAG